MRLSSSDYRERETERREEQREYDADVFYGVWRSGGNADAIDSDRVRDHFYDGLSSDEAAREEIRSQHRPSPQDGWTEQEQVEEQEEQIAEEPSE